MKKSRGRFYTAEQRWISAFGRFFLNITNLGVFYGTTMKSLDVGKSLVEEEWRQGFRDAAADPAYVEMKTGNPFFGNEQLGEKFADAMGTRSVRLAKQTVGASALVFAHTLLDEVLSDACWMSFSAAPQDWYRFVANRRIEIEQLQSQSLEENLNQVVSESIEQLQRESMMKRLQRIHEICIPRLQERPAPTQWIEVSKLERFDEMRHRIVHEARFTKSIKTVEEDIYFAKQAGISVLMLLYQAYGFVPEKGAQATTERDMLRICAIARREFPEVWELIQESASEFRKTEA